MSWRTVAITGRAKLDFKLGYMVVRKEEERQLFLDEVSVLMLESTQISLTTHLIQEIIKRKIKMVFCDSLHNPIGELSSFYDNASSSANILEQIEWKETKKKEIWQKIIKEKIKNQAIVLERHKTYEKAEMLREYARNVELGDKTNREGHAAKVYFNALFGNSFSRGQDNVINAALNYGYSLFLSVFNREISGSGYLTQLGINHHNTYNHFNLSCDFIEVFRPMVDNLVKVANFKEFEKDQKRIMLGLLSREIKINGKMSYILPAITLYTKSIFNVIKEDAR